jgi:hypothetical protein
MCYTFKASIANGIISLVTSMIVYANTTNKIVKSLALFFLFVGLMQWYDAIFWMTDKTNVNYFFTKLAMITNHLQPIILYLLISQSIHMNYMTQLSLMTYMAYALVYSIYAFYTIDYTVVTELSSPTLDWKWNNLPGAEMMYFLFLMVFTLVSLNIPGILGIVMLILNFGSFFFSYYTFKRENIGQMWCILASYAPLILINFS